jgi:hypothetical protein
MKHHPFERIRGQDSFALQHDTVELYVTVTAGMLGPVRFFIHEASPIEPYAIAPWAEESCPPNTPDMLVALRGDWFCSAFGENAQAYRDRYVPPHGETANRQWHYQDSGNERGGCWLQTGIELALQEGSCRATTALVNGHSLVYQRHDLSGLAARLNPGHHATIAFPNVTGAGRLSFSPFIHAQTYFEAMERPENRGYSWLKPNVRISDLHAVPCIDGSITDLCSYPARRGFEDIAIVCADPGLEFAWSAVTYAQQGYVWFALRDPKLLASTLLWFSNGGRHYPPWSGRHINVMGIEDITAFFHVGIAASCTPNLLTERGIRTWLEPDAHGRLSIPYIQGVARVPPNFDEVASIRRQGESRISLVAKSGAVATTLCELDFLKTGTLKALRLP